MYVRCYTTADGEHVVALARMPLNTRHFSFAGGCAFAGCHRHVHRVGLCTGHYSQRRRGRKLKPLLAPHGRIGSPCSVCELPAVARGLCRKHYKARWKRRLRRRGKS